MGVTGTGHRLDGWPNSDLNIGAIVSLAPTLTPYVDLLGVDEATVHKVLASWGPGKFDAQHLQALTRLGSWRLSATTHERNNDARH